MSKIQVTINVDDDAILSESGQPNLEDAIRQELGWLHDSGMSVESWSFLKNDRDLQQPSSPAPQFKAATLLTCVHETKYGTSVHASLHPNSEIALSHVEAVKDECDYEADVAGEYFNSDIEEIVFDVSLLRDAPAISPEHSSETPSSLADQSYYLEQAKGEAPLWDRSTAFQLPDGSSIAVLLKQGRVGRDETDSRQWCAVDIVRESPDHEPEPLAVVDYEDDLGLRALVYSPDSEDPVFTKHYGEAISALQSFYYTFGTSSAFPFQKGWVEVRAHDRKEANEMFRAQFPDVNPFILNCASVYDAVTFQHVRKTYENAPDWNVCHMVISADPQPQRGPSLSDKIHAAENKKSPSTPFSHEKNGPAR